MQEYEGRAERWAFLAPWTSLLSGHKVRIKANYTSEHTYRRTFHALELTLEDGFEDEEEAHALAEAVELVATALAACPVAWHTIFVDLCECTDFANPHGEPLVARVEFDCAVFLAENLLMPLGQRFFFALMDERSSRSEAFKASLHHLGLVAKGALANAPPVAITFRLAPDPGVVDGGQCLAFVHALRHYSSGGQNKRPWCVVEAIDFDGVVPATASELIQHTGDEEAPLVKVSRVAIRPRDGSCSAAELRQFFMTLTRTYPDVEVELSKDCELTDSDESQSSLHAKIAIVMEAIANAGVTIKCLRIGTYRDLEVRRLVWHQLFTTLLHRHAVSHIECLDLSGHCILEHETAADEIGGASTNSAGHQTPSMLTLTSTNQASLHAVISAFRLNLRHLSIVESPTPISSDTVVFILESCPKLEYLDLNNVVLDSMDMFSGRDNGCLSTLALTNLTLHDPSSITRFFTRLADSQSSLGRRLGEFRLARVGDPAIVWDRFLLDATHLVSLDHALRANGRLHTVDVEVQDETPDWVMTEFMHKHRELAAVQRAPLASACKWALLSATSHAALNHDILTHVFQFAAECMPRWVHVGKSLMDLYVY